MGPKPRTFRRAFREMSDHWWMANRSDIENYQQFKSLFKAKYWSETTKNLIRDNICPVSYTHLDVYKRQDL